MAFMLIRTDDNGHSFVVREGMTRWQADAVAAHMRRGHKQVYQIEEYQTEAERADLMKRYGLVP